MLFLPARLQNVEERGGSSPVPGVRTCRSDRHVACGGSDARRAGRQGPERQAHRSDGHRHCGDSGHRHRGVRVVAATRSRERQPVWPERPSWPEKPSSETPQAVEESLMEPATSEATGVAVVEPKEPPMDLEPVNAPEPDTAIEVEPRLGRADTSMVLGRRRRVSSPSCSRISRRGRRMLRTPVRSSIATSRLSRQATIFGLPPSEVTRRRRSQSWRLRAVGCARGLHLGCRSSR